MTNPIVAIRKEKELTIADLSVLSNISITTIHRVEKGSVSRVTPELLTVFERMGYDKKQVESDYSEWRKKKLKELEAKIG